MKKQPISPEEFIKFFEKAANVRFIDVDTRKPALEVIAKNKSGEVSAYYQWLEQQDEDVKLEQKMGAL